VFCRLRPQVINSEVIAGFMPPVTPQLFRAVLIQFRQFRLRTLSLIKRL
jgi:hypothetical protein